MSKYTPTCLLFLTVALAAPSLFGCGPSTHDDEGAPEEITSSAAYVGDCASACQGGPACSDTCTIPTHCHYECPPSTWEDCYWTCDDYESSTCGEFNGRCQSCVPQWQRVSPIAVTVGKRSTWNFLFKQFDYHCTKAYQLVDTACGQGQKWGECYEIDCGWGGSYESWGGCP
jgi:hypothetical protein